MEVTCKFTHMKAAIWYGGKNIKIEEIPVPDIAADQALIKVKAVGICGSELHAFTGASKRRVPPLVMGHEFSGEVAKVGGNSITDLKVGDRVAVEPIIGCGRCVQCLSGLSNICSDRKLIGMQIPGALAEYVAVPASKCHQIPENVSFEEATLCEPLGNAIRAVNQCFLQTGDDVLVLGSGVIGLMAIQVARHHTSGKIIATDVVDEKLKLAKKFGADYTINSRNENVIERVMEITGGKGADCAIEVVGHADVVSQAIASTKRGGIITLVGLWQQMMNLDIMDVVSREIRLQGHYGYIGYEFKVALKLLADKKIDTETFASVRYPLERVVDAVEDMATSKVLKSIVCV